MKPFPTRITTGLSLVFNLVATILLLVVALWQHVAGIAATAQVAFGGLVQAGVGGIAMALGWVFTGLTFIVTLAVYMLVLGLRYIRHLAED